MADQSGREASLLSRRDLLRYGVLGTGAALTTPLWSTWALAAAPAVQPKKGGTIVIAWEADPGVLVPGLSTGGATVRALVLMYDSLVGEDYTKSASQVDTPPLIPGLAERGRSRPTASPTPSTSAVASSSTTVPSWTPRPSSSTSTARLTSGTPSTTRRCERSTSRWSGIGSSRRHASSTGRRSS